MITTLCVDDELRAAIERIMTYACQHPLDIATIRSWHSGSAEVSMSPEHYHAAQDLRICFGIEEQPMPPPEPGTCWCRHLGLWRVDDRKVHEIAAAMLLALFGFHRSIPNALVWTEDGPAMHYIEPIRADEDHRTLYLAAPWRSRPPTFS